MCASPLGAQADITLEGPVFRAVHVEGVVRRGIEADILVDGRDEAAAKFQRRAVDNRFERIDAEADRVGAREIMPDTGLEIGLRETGRGFERAFQACAYPARDSVAPLSNEKVATLLSASSSDWCCQIS